MRLVPPGRAPAFREVRGARRGSLERAEWRPLRRWQVDPSLYGRALLNCGCGAAIRWMGGARGERCSSGNRGRSRMQALATLTAIWKHLPESFVEQLPVACPL